MSERKVSRFRVLTAGLLLELCGGSIYIVSLYLHQVQVIWFPNDDNSLEKVESLAFACNLGNWIPIAGFFYDWRYGGPRNTVLAASFLTLVGYGGLWLCSVHVPEGGYSSAGRLWLLRILWFMWGHGSGYFDCACIATTAHNFAKERGTAMGVVKALYGLSGSLLTQPYKCFFSSDAPAFLAFLGIGLSSLGTVVAPFVRVVDFTPAMMAADSPLLRLRIAFILIFTLALIMAAAGVLRSLNLVSTGLSYGILSVAIGGVIALLGVSYGSSVSTAHRVSLMEDQDNSTAAEKVVDGSGPSTASDDPGAAAAPSTTTPINAATEPMVQTVTFAEPERSPPPRPLALQRQDSLTNAPVTETLLTANFWLIFVAFFAGTGGGLTITNHIEFIVLAQFGPSRHTDAKRTSDALISLFSVFNCLGRLGAGMGSDIFRRYINRPTVFALATALMGIAHGLLLGAQSVFLLYAAIVCAGVSYGAFWSLVPSLVGELFGLAAFASTYMAYSLATSSASLILSTTIASRVAEAHTPPSPPPPPGAPPPPPPDCYGDECYRLTHLIIIGCCAVGALCVGVVSVRTRHFYRARL